jgi:HAD superfamily hydrolase (TIGR01662 family)
MKRSVIFFDLGSTLLYAKAPWPPIFQKADQALAAVLQQANIPFDAQALYQEFSGFLDAYYADREKGTIEKTTPVALRELLAQAGFPNVDESTIRAAIDAMYSVTQQNWYLEEDALPTLDILTQRGYRLGIISNTSDDKNVQQLIDRHGLRHYFDHIVTSAGCGVRKPDPRIFQIALDHFQTRPEAAVMIGDTLEADILGANQMGIYSIWLTRRATIPDEEELTIQPQAVISTLADLPSLLDEIESD